MSDNVAIPLLRGRVMCDDTPLALCRKKMSYYLPIEIRVV